MPAQPQPLHYESLPYIGDARAALAALGNEPWSAWLDSGYPGLGHGRFDILVARPVATLFARGGVTQLREQGRCRLLRGDPIAHLQAWLAQRPAVASDPQLPFVGGALGYFSYDLGRRLLRVAGASSSLPEMAVGFYESAIVTDHQQRSSVAVGSRLDRAWLRSVVRRLQRRRRNAEPCGGGGGASPPLLGETLAEPDRAGYLNAFQRVQDYLHAGDCYQINLARRFRAAYRGDPQQAYLALRQRAPAPFGAWLRWPGHAVLSLSPERFIAVDEAGQVLTQPIKGTRPRGHDAPSDEAQRRALCASAKERAENVMIVDLLRNDLGKHCIPGTVRVPELCQPHRFATVHHLISTVTGTLAAPASPLDLLRDALPGGSVTGAPKRRAVEIIEALEPGPRGLYCGTIGYIGADGRMDSNIAIRTAVCARGQLTYWAGGAVVVDSTATAEFQETLDKAAAFLGACAGGAGQRQR
ncbi:aminodeoxychorismate synthase, component I [Halorhodospira abdelmalekii]|nr:aminodeoxychorismate synthase, component I [Halorhodospira abdelmalekii]